MRFNLVSVVIFGLLLLGWGGTTPPGVGATAGTGANRPLVAEASRPPMAAPAVCSVVFSEGFESGTFGQFVPSGPYPGWQIAAGHAPGCCAVAAFGGPSPGDTKRPAPAPGAAPAGGEEYFLTTSSPFTIPANASSASLSLWWHSIFYPGLPARFTPELSVDDGATWVVLTILDSTIPNWTQETLDVTAYKGVPVLLRLHFLGNFGVPDHNVYIDDIVLDAVIPGCATPTPGPPQTPSRTATPTPTHAVHAGQFEDVPPGSTFYDFVECMGTRGIISGYPCGGPGEPCYVPPKPYFRTNNPVTRGQVSKMVASAAGWTDPVPSSQQTFADVPPGSTFWAYIEQLAGHGAVGGYPCGGPFEPCVAPTNRPYFRPNNNLTRGQLAKIVAEAAQYTETPTGQLFQDVPPTNTFYLWVQRVGSRGIVSGYPCGGLGEPCPGLYYRPNNNVTRGQTAKIVTNTFFPNCQNPPSPTPTRPPDPTATTTATATPTGSPATATPLATTTPTASATVTATPTP